jgi:hypothetical protein
MLDEGMTEEEVLLDRSRFFFGLFAYRNNGRARDEGNNPKGCVQPSDTWRLRRGVEHGRSMPHQFQFQFLVSRCNSRMDDLYLHYSLAPCGVPG